MVFITDLEDCDNAEVPEMNTVDEDNQTNKPVTADDSDDEALEKKRKNELVSCGDEENENNANFIDDANDGDEIDEGETASDVQDDKHEKENNSEMKRENAKRSGMDIVKDVLKRTSRKARKKGDTKVKKSLDLQYDLGTLLAVDTNELDLERLRDSKEEYLKNLARDNTQLLISHIWQLPITRQDTEIVAKLPLPKFVLPREKPLPIPKPMTKWEKFAREKGIQKKDRPRVQWDETLQKWVPWWGYKKVKAEQEKNWAIEVRDNDDPTEDPFAKKKSEKRERTAKNEYQRLRNLAKANNVKIPRTVESQKAVSLKMAGIQEEKRGKNRRQSIKNTPKQQKENVPRMGFLTVDKMSSAQLTQALTISKASTASLGKFQRSLPKEKTANNVKRLLPMVRKRRAAQLNSKQEKDANLKVIDAILNKRPKLNVEKAVNRQIHQEQKERAEEKSKMTKSKGKRKKGGGKRNEKGKDQGKVKKGGKIHKGGTKQKKSAGRKKR